MEPKSGGYMRVQNPYNNEVLYIEDESIGENGTAKAISKMDEVNLKKIAKDMNIDYIHMEKQSNIDKKIDEIKKKYEADTKESKNGYKDTYYILALPLLALLIYELINYKRQKII